MDQIASQKSREIGPRTQINTDPAIKAARCIFDMLALAAAVAMLGVFFFCAASQHGVFRIAGADEKSTPDTISLSPLGR